MKSLTTAAIGIALICSFAQPACAEMSIMIEDFESYDSGVGDWQSSANGVSVVLSTNSTDAIEGNRDLSQTLGVNLLGGGYTVSNSNLDVQVPPQVQNFRFKHRPLLGLNVNKTVQVRLTDQDNNNYNSPVTPLGTLVLGQITDFNIGLSTFTPPVSGEVMTRLTGVRFAFNSTVAVAADERLDSIRFTYDISSIGDWEVY